MRQTLPLLLLAAAGCTTGPGITPMAGDPDVFVLVREGTVSLQQPDMIAKEAQAEALTHCEARGRAFELIDVQTSKNWNMTGNVPVYKMRFRCVPRAVTPTQAAGSAPG